MDDDDKAKTAEQQKQADHVTVTVPVGLVLWIPVDIGEMQIPEDLPVKDGKALLTIENITALEEDLPTVMQKLAASKEVTDAMDTLLASAQFHRRKHDPLTRATIYPFSFLSEGVEV